MSIYHIIKEISKRKKITHKEIAEVLNVTETQVTNYLNGRSKISADQVPQFARLLRVPISELYSEPGTKRDVVSVNDEGCKKCAEKDAEIIQLKSKLLDTMDKYTKLLEELQGGVEKSKQCG